MNGLPIKCRQAYELLTDNGWVACDAGTVWDLSRTWPNPVIVRWVR